MATCSHAFSRPWLHSLVFPSSSDWFTALSASVVNGQSDCLGFGFTTQLKTVLWCHTSSTTYTAFPLISQCAVPGKIHTHPMESHWKFLGGEGGGVLKARILEEKYEAKLELPGGRGGGGAKQKTFCGESMDIFWNCTMIVQQEANTVKK